MTTPTQMPVDTPFTRLLGCPLPIQSAPMAGVVRDAALPAAVAAAGGHGMMPGAFLSAPYLARVLDDLERSGTRAFGVNFVTLLLDPACLEVAASRAPLVDFFFGMPDPGLVARVHEAGALASWQVVSAEEARAAQDAGCDLVVAQGVEAGGHPRGELGLLALLDEVLGAVDVPVVAAGGIGGPRGVAAALAAGAAGVRAGTRFIAAEESAAHRSYKEALVAARARDAVLTRRFCAGDPVETTQRVLRSSLDAAERLDVETAGELVVGGMRLPAPRFGSLPPTEGSSGALDAMPLYAGQSVEGVRRVEPAGAIVAELARGAAVLAGGLVEA
ncbi:MAG TPA: nitronate monooxygenase [Baekduia sp.]|nr:nitronate monooxygenase [Baekduia sp.]